MTYPFDRLGAFANANLELSLQLADIARQSGQGGLKATVTMASVLGEIAGSQAGPEKRLATLSEQGAGLFREAEKLREQVLADTRAAFESWREAWTAAAILPDDARLSEACADLLRFWQSVSGLSPKSGERD